MSLSLFRRREVYYYRGTIGPTGNRKHFYGSCKTKNKDIAARQAAEIEARYWKGNFDGSGAILTFANAAGLFRASGRTGRFLDKIERHFGQTLVKDITPGAVKEMAIKLYPNCTGASLNRLAIGPTMAVINFCVESELCAPIRVKRFKVETKVKEPATLEWVKAFRTEAAPHLGAFALFMFMTGARPGEALALQWEDLDLKNGRTALIRQTKVDTERKAHLPDMLVVALANLERVKGRGVFVYRNRNDLELAWMSAIARAGIKRLTPHCCRHGFATALLRAGIDVVTIAKLGGWKSPAQVFATYGHANDDTTLTDVLARAPAVQMALLDAKNERKTGTT